jgi:hypothetical protein
LVSNEVRTLSSCSWLADACMNTMNSMPPFQRAVMLPTPWANTRAAPNSVRETATVTTDASVRLKLRRRLVPVSRVT